MSPELDRSFAVPANPGAPAAPGPLPGPGPVRWGVLGSSSTVARLAVIPAILASPKAELVATASLAGVHPDGGGRAYASYEELLADPDVEAVYIPLPNHLHRGWTEAAAAAGKHVLCEKPLAPTAADAQAMADATRDAGVLLLEAYMTPFHPRDRALADHVRAGRLGELRTVQASFGFPLRDDTNHRWDPAAGGGALLDVGVYCLAPILAIVGHPPQRVAAAAVMTPSGVDATFTAWLDFGDGLTAGITCSFEVPEHQQLSLVGTQGRIDVETAFTAGPTHCGFDVITRDGAVERVDTGGADPYRGMIDHFQTVLRGGAPLRRTPGQSVALLTVMDDLRFAARHVTART
ncbi:MAG: Gfo/Idh/MocA family oxidoreductase [Acidimicrobiales bacterium]